jgi:DUF917 family protein
MISGMCIDEQLLEAAVLGGTVLGGGGGGARSEGMNMGRAALERGTPRFCTIDDLGDDALVATVAVVGAPSQRDAFIEPEDYVGTVQHLQALGGKPLTALMTNENGGWATVNGWMQSAVLGLPLLDAACNGRAHPTSLMGSMGLHRQSGYVSLQAAAGGNPAKKEHIEIAVKGTLEQGEQIVRMASTLAGGMVAVARNPVPASYIKAHGAVGAISHAVKIGRAIQTALPHGVGAVAKAICDMLQGQHIDEASISTIKLATHHGFDAGIAHLTGSAGSYTLSIWNEYMALDRDGKRLATFPDLIVTIDAQRGLPLTSAELKDGQRIFLVTTAKQNLILGAGMHDRALFAAAEQALGISLIPYAFPEEKP